MLCKMAIKDGIGAGSKTKVILLDVPDDVFMRRLALYGEFRPAEMTTEELAKCVFIGLPNTMKYIGPAEEKDIE
jgi:hypothetical protein